MRICDGVSNGHEVYLLLLILFSFSQFDIQNRCSPKLLWHYKSTAKLLYVAETSTIDFSIVARTVIHHWVWICVIYIRHWQAHIRWSGWSGFDLNSLSGSTTPTPNIYCTFVYNYISEMHTTETCRYTWQDREGSTASVKKKSMIDSWQAGKVLSWYAVNNPGYLRRAIIMCDSSVDSYVLLPC